jgi:hypothetical protein
MQNRIDAELSAAARGAILDSIEQINTKAPLLINLTKEERSELPKMGDKSRAFVQAALALAEEDDSFLPRSFDKAEMRQDEDLYNALNQVYVPLTILYEKLQDTMLLTGSDLYVAALEVYAAAKRSGQGEGLDQLVDALGRRFARRPKAETPPPPPPTP